jgi:hypothetical protein
VDSMAAAADAAPDAGWWWWWCFSPPPLASPGRMGHLDFARSAPLWLLCVFALVVIPTWDLFFHRLFI